MKKIEYIQLRHGNIDDLEANFIDIEAKLDELVDRVNELSEIKAKLTLTKEEYEKPRERGLT